MEPTQGVAIFLAGVAAGTLNTVVGSGSLISFPTILFFGYPILVANVSNTIGIFPGSVSGVIGYRRELAGQRPRAVPLAAAALVGGLTGAILLLVLPLEATAKAIPVLIIGASVLVAVQPRLAAVVAARRAANPPRTSRDPLLALLVFISGIYGGYFGAGQGVILIALLSIRIDDHLQRLNALKNVLAAVVNGMAALVFVLFAPVAWPVVVALAAGSIVGGQVGAHIGRRLSPTLLRGVIVIVGFVVGVRLLLA